MAMLMVVASVRSLEPILVFHCFSSGLAVLRWHSLSKVVQNPRCILTLCFTYQLLLFSHYQMITVTTCSLFKVLLVEGTRSEDFLPTRSQSMLPLGKCLVVGTSSKIKDAHLDV